jgi:hypothetical protein
MFRFAQFATGESAVADMTMRDASLSLSIVSSGVRFPIEARREELL